MSSTNRLRFIINQLSSWDNRNRVKTIAISTPKYYSLECHKKGANKSNCFAALSGCLRYNGAVPIQDLQKYIQSQTYTCRCYNWERKPLLSWLYHSYSTGARAEAFSFELSLHTISESLMYSLDILFLRLTRLDRLADLSL